jgi:dipeptidyl aminopeptidase/acylaminoacyl peptidase
MKKLLLFLLLPMHLLAQNIPFAAYKSYPFPTQLRAAAKGAKLAWALDQQGRRNVYVAEGPDFTPRQLTNYTEDDGQEITGLAISEDGNYVVFVRGGEHGANWDTGLPTDPGFGLEPFKVQIASIPFAGGTPKYLSEGDDPVISPDSRRVAFLKAGQVWCAPVNGSTAAVHLFTARGSMSGLEWQPGGSSLLFVAGRGDHSVIGIYTDSLTPLKWIAPSFSRDNSPHWSPDGQKIVFVRLPGSGGTPDSLLVRHPLPWSVNIADVATNKTWLVWKSPKTLRGSLPLTDGEANLHWAADEKIVFLANLDGWPHLYAITPSLPSNTSTPSMPTLLTPGPFMCEHIVLSADKHRILFSANTGMDPHDIDRRHVAMVDLDHNAMKVLTPGDGLEWMPVLTGDNNTVAFIRATAQLSPLPAIMGLTGDHKIQPLGLDKVPADFPAKTLITPKPVTFRSPDGLTIHADLFLPQTNSSQGAPKHPAVIYVHGGPPRQMLLGWNYSDYYSNAYACNQYLASLGFVVLAVNYRLGIGYGYEFHQPAHAGLWGAAEYQDIKAAGEWLQHQTFADPERIGIYGGSYGGYLTALALARDSRLFKTGVDIHGVHDWMNQSGLLNTFNNQYEKAPDYDQAVKTAWFSSPVSAIATWTSPVLIIHADDDRNVRFSQSIDLINRLEKKGVPYETLMIPDDTHHLLRWTNAVTVYGAVADYFVKKFKP